VMLFFVLSLLASTNALTYRKGETFSYQYKSNVKTVAIQEANDQEPILYDHTCQANFKVLLVSSKGAYIEMTINNVQSRVGNSESSEEGQHDEDSEVYYSNPLYFTHNTDGSIQDVIVHEDDSEEMRDLKVGIAYTLRSTIFQDGSEDEYQQASVIDPQGSHYEHFQTSVQDEATVVTSRYTEDDFIAFFDADLSAQNVSIDGNNVRTIVGDRIVASKISQSVLLTKNVEAHSNDDEETPAQIYVYGDAEISGYAQGNDAEAEAEFPFESVEAFLNENTKYHTVPYLQVEFYMKRAYPPVEETVPEIDGGHVVCPGDLTVCRGFSIDHTLGNSNIGIRGALSAVAGVKTGCSAAIRSYLVGAYADLDIKILGFTISAAHAYAEYGQLNGSPTRNGIELQVFGVTFYKKTFPWLDCVDRTIQLGQYSKDHSLSYSIHVVVLTVKFSVGVAFSLSANLHYSICAQQLTASVSIIPRGAATAHADASASIVVARAGVTIKGTIAENFDPTAYIDGNQCRVGFYMYANTEPWDVRFVGWYQTRSIKWKHWHPKITWSSKHEHVFWHHSSGGSRTKIIDVFYGAK